VTGQRPAHAVGHKFDRSGASLPFPGNSVVCPVDPSSRLFQEAEWVQRRCQQAGFTQAFTFLPPDSFHMTLFDLVCHEVREPARWSSELPLDVPLEQADAFMAGRLERIQWPGPPRMSVTGLGALGGDHTLRLHLEPDGDAEEAALHTFREAASQATGVRHPVHDRYGFHVSLAYPLVLFSEEQRAAYIRFEQEVTPRLRQRLGRVQLGAPYLSLFENMFAFPRIRP
jgi:hypothetical protein